MGRHFFSQKKAVSPGLFLPLGVFTMILVGLLLMGEGCQREEAGSTKRIRFTTWGSPASNEVFQKVVDEFERRNPDIRVELMMLPWKQYHRKILTMLAAGSKLDFMRLANSYFPRFVENKALFPLDDFIERDRKQIDIDDFYPMALRGCQAEGNFYGLPLDVVGWAIYYNRRLFDLKGLPYPNESWTWDEFIRVAKELTEDLNGDGIIDRYGAYVKFKMGVIELLAGQSGAMILDRHNRECLFDSPEGRAVIQLFYDLMVRYSVVPPVEARAGQDVFAAQTVAMALLMRGMVTQYRQCLAFDWDVAPVPKWPGKEPRALIVGGFNPWVISRNTELPEASWRFLKFFTGKEALTEMVKTGRFVPARKSVAQSPAFLETSPPDNNAVFLDLIQSPNKVFVPRFLHYNRLEKAFEDNFQLLLEGEIDLDQCVTRIAMDVEELTQEEGPE
jgi:multiple sugar transport system substrate-binding protein